jgi:hypothetical protein
MMAFLFGFTYLPRSPRGAWAWLLEEMSRERARRGVDSDSLAPSDSPAPSGGEFEAIYALYQNLGRLVCFRV